MARCGLVVELEVACGTGPAAAVAATAVAEQTQTRGQRQSTVVEQVVGAAAQGAARKSDLCAATRIAASSSSSSGRRKSRYGSASATLPAPPWLNNNNNNKSSSSSSNSIEYDDDDDGGGHGQQARAGDAWAGTLARCRRLCAAGRVADAVAALESLLLRPPPPPLVAASTTRSRVLFILRRLLPQQHGKHLALELVRRVHALAAAAAASRPLDPVVATQLIRAYAGHGRLDLATTAFEQQVQVGGEPSAHAWAAIISAHAKHGDPAAGVRLYRRMTSSTGSSPPVDSRVWSAALKACAGARDLDAGRQVHAHIQAAAAAADRFVQAGLVSTYAKCGAVEEARDVFDRVPAADRDAVTWTAMIAGYAQQGMGREALELYYHSTPPPPRPDGVMLACLLQACASVGEPALATGERLHEQLLQQQTAAAAAATITPLVGGSLVNMYAKCGALARARAVLESLPPRAGRGNVAAWNALLAGYAQQGLGEQALALFDSGVVEPQPTCVTFLCLLQACAAAGDAALGRGRRLHALVARRGMLDQLGSSLVCMYAKCGSVDEARAAWDALPPPRRDVVAWTALVAGYARRGRAREALRLYFHDDDGRGSGGGYPGCSGAPPLDAVAYACLLQACAAVGVAALEHGTRLHADIRRLRLLLEPPDGAVVLGCSLVNMYCKCGSVDAARAVFDALPHRTAVTWTAMIGGYAGQGRGRDALALWERMRRRGEGGPSPTPVTYVCVLQACAEVGAAALEEGRRVHREILERGHASDEAAAAAVAGSVVNMYAKCGAVDEARRAFDAAPVRDTAAWNAMIAGYAQQGRPEDAIRLYSTWLAADYGDDDGSSSSRSARPDAVTYVCLLHACAAVGALSLGARLHAQLAAAEDQQRLHPDPADDDDGGSAVILGAAVVNMYAKCGAMQQAQEAFDALPARAKRAAPPWTALMTGYAHAGDPARALPLVDAMLDAGAHPDGVTFLALLTACSHAGRVEQGRAWFARMQEQQEFGVSPATEHFTCVVDMLARAGRVDEAVRLAADAVRVAAEAPTAASDGGGAAAAAKAAVWNAVLAGCRKWGDVERARRAFRAACGAGGAGGGEDGVGVDEDDANDASDDAPAAQAPPAASAAPAAAYVMMADIYAGTALWEPAGRLAARRRQAEAYKEPGRSWWADGEGQVQAFMVPGRRHHHHYPDDLHLDARLHGLLANLKDSLST